MGKAFRSMHAVLRWMRMLDFNPEEVTGEIPQTPCVMVANHPTLVDISAILATEPNLIFPAKASLFRTFWARPMLEAAHQLHIPERDPFAVKQVVEGAIHRLQQGNRIIIFPEGTRSPADRLLPFGRMAFEIAARANVPVVPIVITCEPRWLTRDCSFFASNIKTVPKLRLKALEPVYPSPEGEQGSSSRTLRDIVSRLIHLELGMPWPSETEADQAKAMAEPETVRAACSLAPTSSSLPESSVESSLESHDARIA